MAKNILIFSDGTGQAGGQRPDQTLSNVYKLFRATRVGPDSPINPSQQIAFYETGLGSGELSGPGFWRAYTWVRKTLSSAFGTGYTRNVADCYEKILSVYEPGDRIYLFGFSRGAYTVRSVGGVMNLCGVPTKDATGNPIPRSGRALRAIADEAVHEVYEHGAGHARADYEEEREEKARRFRIKYGTQDDPVANQRGNIVPFFIGVFDTVAALGSAGVKKAALIGLVAVAALTVDLCIAAVLRWIFDWSFWPTFLYLSLALGILVVGFAYWKRIRSIKDFVNPGKSWKFGKYRLHLIGWKFKNYDRFLDRRVVYARHAQAIDETRASFARVEWGRKVDEANAPRPDWLVQKWFAGNHSDIGGSYPESESRLSDIALKWMLEEAENIPHPIIVDHNSLHLFPDIAGAQHCEVSAGFELYPNWFPRRWRKSWNEKSRPDIALVDCHPTVLERFKIPTVIKCGIQQRYQPACLRNDPALAEYYRD